MSSVELNKPEAQSSTQKRRNRRKRTLINHRSKDDKQSTKVEAETQPDIKVVHLNEEVSLDQPVYYGPCNCPDCSIVKIDIGTMTNDPVESREKVKAAREAKKAAKQQAKMKRDAGLDTKPAAKVQIETKKEDTVSSLPIEVKTEHIKEQAKESTSKIESNPKGVKSKDEVDRAAVVDNEISLGSELDKEQIKADRAAKKAAKQAKKKGAPSGDIPVTSPATVKADTEMTVRDVVQTLRDIKMVALEVKAVTAQVQALSLDKKEPEKKAPTPKEQAQVTQVADTKPTSSNTKDVELTTKESDEGKSKAQLKAERRAKQEAQRAAKEAAALAKTAAVKTNEAKPKNTQLGSQSGKEDGKNTLVKEKSPKPKTPSKQSPKQGHRVNWFKHLYNEDKTKLDKLPINSNLHPAIIKLGVQLATRVVAGSNARCIALLDALKKMVRDYSLPARTEFGRGLEAHLAASLAFLWGMRQPTASQLNAVNFFRHRLTQLPNNVDEFDAKKTLQEEIDRYIREQIDMAGEAISITVRSKISDGDLILTYGCSSLIERILVEAHAAGIRFRVVAVGVGGASAAREMTRRLAARRVPCLALDILALGFIMPTVNKVVLGASALLANGSVLGAAGTGAVALAARGSNVPVLVACETHKFCERVHTDSFLYNELGDPDDLIDKSDDNSPLKDWRNNPNLTPLNLTYDVTPATLVTAVVTELGILPCTSAPVVLRFKLSEYSV